MHVMYHPCSRGIPRPVLEFEQHVQLVTVVVARVAELVDRVVEPDETADPAPGDRVGAFHREAIVRGAAAGEGGIDHPAVQGVLFRVLIQRSDRPRTGVPDLAVDAAKRKSRVFFGIAVAGPFTEDVEAGDLRAAGNPSDVVVEDKVAVRIDRVAVAITLKAWIEALRILEILVAEAGVEDFALEAHFAAPGGGVGIRATFVDLQPVALAVER